MTGKHKNWHKRWQVDLSACTATHDSGLIFKFTLADDGEWDGSAVNLDSWQDSMAGKMPLPDLAQHAQRLAREAGDAYLWQLKKRH